MRRDLILFLIVIVIFFGMSHYGFFPLFFHSIGIERSLPLPVFSQPDEKTWAIQSIDTMKYSRDLARAKLNDDAFSQVIDTQVRNIAETGANYVAIDTPYDQEFFPMLSRWVLAARKYNLHVWFRGNFSGWENWFGYPRITRAQHMEKTQSFILDHSDIFEDGDIFSACPECENGGPGDPRHTGDVNGFRNFIITEYALAQGAFEIIGKKVSANYYPMNADVAKLVMDKQTTLSMGSVVVVDHYVNSPEVLVEDIRKLQEKTGGKIVLGEFGAPIPGIHGKMTESEQAQWVESVLGKLSSLNGVGGVNYWSNAGGTTGIWDKNGKAFSAVPIIKKYFKPEIIFGVVTDERNRPIGGARISSFGTEVISRDNGYFELRSVTTSLPFEISVSAGEFLDQKINIAQSDKQIHVVLRKK